MSSIIARRLEAFEVSVVASEAHPHSNINQLLDENTVLERRWQERGVTVTDDTFVLPTVADSGNFNIGWWSAVQTMDDGLLSTEPTLTFTIAATAVTAVFIDGDYRTDNYPVDFDLEYYLGPDLIQTDTIRDNVQVRLQHNTDLTSTVDRVVLRLIRGSQPNTFLRLASATLGVRDVRALMINPTRTTHARVTISYIQPFEPEFARVATSTNTNSGTNINQVVNNVNEPTVRWISPGDNSTDGTWYALPTLAELTDLEVGWWSDTESNSDGTFTVFPEITVTFTERLVLSYNVFGDTLANTYPVDFDVVLRRAGADVQTFEVRNNTEPLYVAFLSPTSVLADTMIVRIRKINKGSVYARLLDIGTSVREVYTRDDLYSVSWLTELHYFDGNIPIGSISSNEVNISLVNANDKFDPLNTESPVATELKRNRRVQVEFGIEEIPGRIRWFQAGIFYTVNWSVDSLAQEARVLARDRLELLAQTQMMLPIQINQTIAQLATTVLTDYGLTPSEFMVDSTLDDIIPVAWFGRGSHKDALRKIAQNSLANVYVDANEVIHVEDTQPGVDVNYQYSDTVNLFGRSYPFSWVEQVNVADVIYNNVLLDPVAQQILNITDPIQIPANSSLTLTLQFNTDAAVGPINYTFNTDPQITSTVVQDSSWGATVTFTNTDATQVRTVTSVSAMATRYSITQRVTYSVSDAEEVADAGPIRLDTTIEGDFIQTLSYAQTLATEILQRFSLTQSDVTLETTGHIALPVGSRIQLLSANETTSRDYMLIRQDLLWDGGLSSIVEGRTI